MNDLTTYAQLGGTVVTVILFLNYLNKKDNKWTDWLKDSSKSNIELAKALQKLTVVVENNSTILNNTFYNRTANTEAVKENTEVIDKGTKTVIEAVKNSNGNGK